MAIGDDQKFNFVSPGIQVNEIDNSQLPQDLSTDRGPVIIGRTKRGPGMRPVKVGSFEEFVQVFGEPVPGGKGGDVWREGNETAPMYASYAAQAWLENSDPATIIRLLGDQSSNATSNGKAGWTTKNDINASTGSNGGAYGLFVMNSGSNADGTLAATFYLQEGSMVLSGNRPDQTATASAASLIESVGSDKEFRAQIFDAQDNLVEEKLFNFNRDSQKYIRKVFNTNPIKTNSALVNSEDQKTYWLGNTFERHMNDIVSGSAGEQFGSILGLEATDSTLDSGKGNDFEFGHKSASTGWFFSQHLGPTGSFDARDQQKLFRFHSLQGGKWDSSNLKISIENITAPTNNFQDYGTFDVVIRRANDDDGAPQVLERYTSCKLDPQSPDFLARKIGNKYRTWNENENRFEHYGEFDNQSQFVRVEMNRDVKDGAVEPALLPYGVYGPLRNRGFSFISGNTDAFSYKDTTSTFGAVFAKGIGNIPKTSGDSEFVETGGVDITGNLEFRKMALQETASQAPTQTPEDTYFGVDTSTAQGSSRFDKGWADLTRILPGDFATKTSEDKHVEYSWIFTLDDISGSQDGTDAYWVSGSRQSGTSITATGSANYEEVLNQDYDSFTAPLFGGFDGVDITEKNPFRNDAITDGATREQDYQTFTIKQAVDAVSDPEVVEHDLISVPGIKDSHLTDYVIETAKRRGDTLAVIDLEDDYKPRHEGTLTDNQQRGSNSNIISTMKSRNIDNSFAAAYTPWVQIRDNVNDAHVWVPPSIPAIGSIAFTEESEALWFAPAGFTRGGLSEGAAGVQVTQVSRRLRKPDRDDLYEANINPIAQFPAEGIVIMGQKTLQAQASALDRVNVRRLMNHIEKGISRIARTTLFEPNVRSTWNKFLAKAQPFLEDIAGSFGLNDYRLVLDRSTTTPDLIDRNIMKAKVMVKPTKSIEFIGLDFVVTNEGAAFAEG